MKKCIKLILGIIFITSLLSSVILFIIFISKTYLDKKFNTLFFSLFCIMILLVVVVYFLINITLNEFEKNNKSYISKRFSFLLNKGYKMSYLSINGKSVSSFFNGNITFDLIIENQDIDLSVKRGIKFPYHKEENICKILRDVDYKHCLNLLSPMNKVDLFAELIQEKYDEIINYISK